MESQKTDPVPVAQTVTLSLAVPKSLQCFFSNVKGGTEWKYNNVIKQFLCKIYEKVYPPKEESNKIVCSLQDGKETNANLPIVSGNPSELHII